MNVKKFNISKPRKYQDKAGNEKTQWNQIGIITEFHKEDGSVSRIIEIPAIGLEANIFPFQPKTQEGGYGNTAPTQQAPAPIPQGDADYQDIPF